MSDTDDTIYVHHHPDNKPSPMLDRVVEAVVKDFKKRRDERKADVKSD